jgi:hypothetical protein
LVASLPEAVIWSRPRMFGPDSDLIASITPLKPHRERSTMTQARRFTSIVVVVLILLLVSVIAIGKYEQNQARVLIQHRAMSDLMAESIIYTHYSATVGLGRRIKDFEIVGSWSVEDVTTCVYMPLVRPCQKRVRLKVAARDLTTHQPVLTLNPTWIVFGDFTERPDNEDAKTFFARIGEFNSEDPAASVRKFVNGKFVVSGFPTEANTTGHLLLDVGDKPVRSFFLSPMFKRDPSCANCYFVYYAVYIEGQEYAAIFSVNLDTDYIAPVSDDAKAGKIVYLQEPSWNDQTAARKIVFDGYDPNFSLPSGDHSDTWTFAKSPSCKKCFYVTRQIIQPVTVNSYRTFKCVWEVNIETGISQPWNRDARVAFRLSGTRNPYETEYGNALEMR